MKNTSKSYGLMAKSLHWLMAAAIIGMFWLGLEMMGRDYYDPLYRTLPLWHKSIGILLFAVLVFRLVWRWASVEPEPEGSALERKIARWVHRSFYLLILAIMISGYLISTADGRAIDVFSWFSVPATVTSIPNQEDIAGDIHELLAWLVISLAALHALAALKHHFIDKDNTLRKMTFSKRRTP